MIKVKEKGNYEEGKAVPTHCTIYHYEHCPYITVITTPQLNYSPTHYSW